MFNAFSPLSGGQMAGYYRDKDYPIDLNGALDYMRPASGVSVFPFPTVIGFIEGTLPLFDAQVFSTMWGERPTGPWMGAPQGPLDLAFPNIQGGFSKAI
jgi:hypothetical protein